MHGRILAKGSSRRRVAAAWVLGSALLWGCTGSPFDNRPDYGRVNLAPGVTRACYQDPCAVTLTLPAGDGTYTVRANGVVVGSYAAGQPADLGSFSRQDSPVMITLDGVERGTAVLYLLEKHQY